MKKRLLKYNIPRTVPVEACVTLVLPLMVGVAFIDSGWRDLRAPNDLMPREAFTGLWGGKNHRVALQSASLVINLVVIATNARRSNEPTLPALTADSECAPSLGGSSPSGAAGCSSSESPTVMAAGRIRFTRW